MIINELIPVLQIAVGPAILISGNGLLLLTMTNRLGRVIDRSRLLVSTIKHTENEDHENSQSQLKVLLHRGRLLRSAIFMAAMSALLAALLIILVFLSVLMKWEIGWLLSIIFMGSMLGIMGSLVSFLRDVNVTLHALAIEVRHPS
jgi:uncharacterized membrane protein